MPLGSVYSSKYIRAIEENAFSMGLSPATLMESAGRCVADFVAELLRDAGKEVAGERVLVLVGRGGNGGDALVAARYLRTYGADVRAALLFEPRAFTHSAAALNYELWVKHGGEVLEAYTRTGVRRLAEELEGHSVVVDGIFGTGVRYPLPEHVAEAIEAASSARGPIRVSIDVPSGLDPDAGIVGRPHMRSDYTVALHYLKKVYFVAPEACGQIRLCNLGIPSAAEEFVGPGHLRNILRAKPPDAKKGDGGRVVVVGGSADYVGAPALAGMAALKAGADLAYVVVPRSIRSAVASFSPSLITVPLGGDYLDAGEIGRLASLLARVDSVVLGPGMSLNQATLEFFRAFAELWVGSGRPPLIVDADALKALAQARLALGGRGVVTPHRGEFEKLCEAYGVEGGPLEFRARLLAKKIEGVVLLKGPVDVICDPEGCLKNKTGNPGMSTGGTGDVLAGVVAAFVKRTESLFEAASIAAYVNGLAGDLLSRERGEFFDSSDLLGFIPLAIKSSLEARQQ